MLIIWNVLCHLSSISFIIIIILFRYMYHVLTKNTTVTDHNRNLLVETIRSITEILIWGDQNDSSVFEWVLPSVLTVSPHVTFAIKYAKSKSCSLFVASFWKRTCLHFSSTYYGRNPDGMCVSNFCKRSTSFLKTSVMRLLFVSTPLDKVQIWCFLILCLCPEHIICCLSFSRLFAVQ